MPQFIQKFIPRAGEPALLKLAQSFRVITVVGPRQSGKTTLLRKLFPEKPFVSLEDLRNRDFAVNDPLGFLAQFPSGAFIDEVHHAPRLLSQIQVRVDEDKRRGLFLLSGSNNLLVSALGSQTLAGRAVPFVLLPLSISELLEASMLNPDLLLSVMLRGGYPEIWEQQLDPTLASSAYAASYVERDVRQVGNIGDLSTFRSFIELLASHVGQLLNKAALSNALGVSNDTIERWLSTLEATYVCFRLRPWHGQNVKKRLVKTPKIYFYDTGLLCYFLGIENEQILARHPLKGQIFENLQIIEYIKWAYNKSSDPRATFFRDAVGNEVDLLFPMNAKTQAVEIKSSQTFKTSFNKGLMQFSELQPEQRRPIVVLGARDSQKRTTFDIAAWHTLATLLDERLHDVL